MQNLNEMKEKLRRLNMVLLSSGMAALSQPEIESKLQQLIGPGSMQLAPRSMEDLKTNSGFPANMPPNGLSDQPGRLLMPRPAGQRRMV